MYFRHYKVDYKFIRLRNTSTSDAAIGGWLVKQTGEGGECEYKLPAKRVVKAGESVTIWSSGSAEAKGGDDLVMGGGKNWLAGSSVITVVIDKEGTVSGGQILDPQKYLGLEFGFGFGTKTRTQNRNQSGFG